MITEDYVSFETAKLLKEKGFDAVCRTAYETITKKHEVEQCSPSSWGKLNQVKRPTLQMAMKWLREVHKLHIEFVLNQDVQDGEAAIENYYHFNVSRLDRFANEGGDCKFYNSYEEACESAIRYCLKMILV